MALFNKDWNTYKTNWQKGFSQSGFTGGVKSLFQSSNSNSVISNDQVQILRNWNNAVKHGCTNQATFNRIIANADENTKMYFAGLNKGKASMEGLKNAQNVAKTSTIGLTIAQTALNMAISMGLMAAISLAIKGFDKLVNSAKRASEAADEAFSETNDKVQEYDDELKSLDELIAKYKELKESGNLDLEGRKEIKEIQNDIADLVGTQAKNLDLVNGKLDDEIKKLDEISAKEAKRAYETATANYNNSQKANESATGDDSFLFVDGYAYTGKREKEAEKILKEAGFGGNVQSGGFFGNTLFVMDSFDNNMKELKGAQEKADYLQSMIDVLEQNGQRATDLYAGLIKQRDDYLAYIDNQQSAADSLVNSWLTYSQFSNQELSKISVDSVESFETYRQKMIDEAKKDESIGKVLADGTLSEEDLENAINDFMATSLNFSTWYEKWINNVQGSTSNDEITVFSEFSEEQTKAIDDFQSKVKTLGDTLSSLQSGEDIDFTDLIQEFPELQGKSENLEKAIKELIENEWKKLQETLGEGLPSDAKDDLQEYVDTTINASVSLSDAFSSIQKSYEALNDFKSAMSTGMTDDVLNSVGSLSSELNDLVAGFYAGTVTSQELFDALSKHYETDLENYGNALIAKNALSYEFYNSVGLTDTTLINSFKENYGVDISNCKSYNEAKIKIEQQTLGIIGKMWSQFYNAQTQTFTAEMDALEAQIETDPYAEELYSKIKSQTNAYETAIAALNNIVYEGIGTDFEAIGGNLIKNKNSGSDKEDSKSETKETIDWIERYNEMLQKQHDILDEIANDETQSYNERIGALDEMIAKDKERIDIAQKSAQEYKEAWDKAIEGLSNKDISNIMNGSLDIETYDESVLGEEYIDKLKEAMDLYDKFLDMKQKVSDVEKESLDHMREQLKLEEEIIQAEQELIDAKRSVTDANLDYIEASGGVVNAGLYKQQIALSKELESTYHDQIANLEEQIELVDEGSAEYYSLLAAMDDCQAAIIDCQTEQAELNEAIARIPIERLQKYINMLRNIKTDLQNFLDEQSALGINPTADQLQQLIDLSHKEISKLTEQQKELSGLLETYEYGSEKFNEVQDEIQNIDDEISSLIQNQREWNTELLNIPIENLEKVNDNLSTYSSILGEQIDEQEKAHNAVISHLDREIEKYEELKDAVNDKYDPEIEAIQEKIDLLDKTNEKLSIQQRLEQANYDYNKALNNKNILTINEKGEQEYISDIDALREATVEKQEAELAKLKFDLNESKELLEEQKQKELDALDAEIERIEKIQDVWTKVKEEVESISDILSANNVLGSNWQNIVLAGGTENEDLANSWASMYETLTTQKDSVDKQIESNERIISMMNEFVERFNSGALTYEQALNGVNELSHNIEKGYTAMEQLVDMMNLDGIKDLSGISSSADSQIVDSVDLLRDYLGVANDNNTAINEIAKTWTEMQQSIQDQLAELKRLAEELAKKKETAVVFYSDSYEDRYDDDDGSSDGPDTVTKYWVAAGPGFSEEGLRQAIDDGYAIKFDGAGGDPDFGGDNYRSEEEIRDLYEDILDEIETRHTGAAAGPISTTGLSKADKLFQKYALEPDERLTNTKVGEWVITPEQRDNILKAIDFGGLNNNIALSPKLPPISMRETTKSIEVNMGNIVLEGVQDPDGFARAMKAQFGPLLRQEMSKVK